MDAQRHEANGPLFEECRAAAAARGWRLAVYRTTTDNSFSGYTRYTAHVGEARPFGSRSRRARGWEDAPHQRFYGPSVVGEARALRRLLAWLAETAD